MSDYICNGSMTKEERNAKMKRALELRKSGMAVNSIAAEVGCDKTTVYKWFKLNRVPVGNGRRKYDVDLIDRIAVMYQTKTKREIASCLEMDGFEITYIINAYGIRKGESLC